MLPLASILPSTYFDGLSTLWGGCAYVGSSIVAVGLMMETVRRRPEPTGFIWLLSKVFLIALTTVFLREWLMRLNDIVMEFGSMMGIDPRTVDDRFAKFVAGGTAADPNSSVWDIIWGTGSIGTAFSYALLWLFGWLTWSVQYVVKLVGGVLLTAGWALSPIFLSFFMLRPMAGVARKYITGLVALVLWPFGWVLAATVTNAMLDAAATANLIPVFSAGNPIAAPGLTVLLIGSWMLMSSILAPWITTKVLLMGANPAMAMAESMGGVAQAALTGGVGAGVAAATAGVAAPGIVAATAAGVLAAGSESTVRGGGAAKTTGTVTQGISGFYSGSFARRNTEATEQIAAAQTKRASAAESMAQELAKHARKKSRSRSGFQDQPHEDDPNKAALDI